MSSPHRLAEDLYRCAEAGGFVIADPGDGEKINVNVNGGVCALTVAASATETRGLPTAVAGLLGVRLLVFCDSVGSGGTVAVGGVATLTSDDNLVWLTVRSIAGSYAWVPEQQAAEFPSTISVDTINEYTSDTGVTIDGVFIQDGALSAGTVGELISGEGVALDGGKVRDGQFIGTGTVTAETSTTPTLTAAELFGGIITSTQTAAVTATLDTGTAMDTALSAVVAIGQGFYWSLINLGSSSGAATVTASAGHTVVGGGVVAITTSKRFFTKRTAANTWITYEIA